MRANIVIDASLMSAAVQAGDFKTEKEAVQPVLGGR